MWKAGVSYLLILEKISYVMTTDKPSGDDFTSHKLKDKWEEGNVKAILLSHMHHDLILLFK